MVQYKHNEPYYKLQLSELDEDVVRVLAFEGQEQISRLFHYKLELLSEDAELDPAAILNKKATLLFMRGDDDPIPVHGIISHFEQRGRTPDYVSYYAELVPKMWRLDLNFQSRVFQNMNIEQMITEVLETAEFTGDDFEFKLNETYPDIEFAVQYRETDFNYVNRRLEHYGIYYYFEHRDENDVIVFTDMNDNLPAIETEEDIAYNPNKDPLSEQETISRFISQGQVVTGKTQLKDYNYQTPSKELIAESQINSENPGTHSDYGDRFGDESEGEFQVRVRDEAMVSRGTIYKGNGDCRPFHAGYKFTMTDHYRADWNQEFLLTKVILQGNQRSLFGTFPPGAKVPPTYENYFESMPVDIPFRPQRLSLHPKITGVLNAKVDAAGDGSQAEVDDQGRYKVILPFDLSGNSAGEASSFVRMIQPYAGPNYGTHFPLHKDTEVLLTFIDGNPDLPVISGAVPNPETISPVTNANQTKSVIRDNYGNEIVMDATPGDEHIRMYSPHHKSGLILGRSAKLATESDDYTGIVGNSMKGVLGHNLEVIAGAKTDVVFGTHGELKVGGNYNALFGLQTNFSVAGKVSYENEYELKYLDGIERLTTTKDILAAAGADHVITAADQVCIVGGECEPDAAKLTKLSPNIKGDVKDGRSILNVFPEKIILSVGSKKDTYQFSDASRIIGSGEAQGDSIFTKTPGKTAITGAMLTPIIGMYLTALVTTVMEIIYDTMEDNAVSTTFSFINETIAALMQTIFPFIFAKTIREEFDEYLSEDKIEPVGHKKPVARIEMKKDGSIEICSDSKDNGIILNSKKSILHGIGESGKEKYKVEVNENEINLQADKAEIKLSGNGDIFIKNNSASQKIRIVSEGSIALDAGPKIEFLAQKVSAPKGLFETKNIKDIG